VLIGRSRDKDGMETGGIETGVIDTGVIEMLKSSREGDVVIVATAELMLGDTAEQASTSDDPRSECESLIIMRQRQRAGVCCWFSVSTGEAMI
jgi:hypothetical protein